MDSEQFNRLEKEVHGEKDKLDDELGKLLSEKPNYTSATLNATHIKGSNFFTKFESFVSSISSEHESLSKLQVQDVLTSIENILEFSIDYWDTMRAISNQILNSQYAPQNNFLQTSQAILATYRKDKAQELRKSFEHKDIPVSGFISKEKHKLTSIKIDWVSLTIGLTLLIVSGLVVFQIEINTGMKYFFSRILISLSIALIFTGIAKTKIQAKINIPGLAITTVGTIAIFFILYFYNPAEIPIINQNVYSQPHNKSLNWIGEKDAPPS